MYLMRESWFRCWNKYMKALVVISTINLGTFYVSNYLHTTITYRLDEPKLHLWDESFNVPTHDSQDINKSWLKWPPSPSPLWVAVKTRKKIKPRAILMSRTLKATWKFSRDTIKGSEASAIRVFLILSEISTS